MIDNEKLECKYQEYIALRNYTMTRVRKSKPELNYLVFEITHKCNARCDHCSHNCEKEVEDEELTTEEVKKVLKDVADRYDARKIGLGFTGGEPLLRKDLIEIAQYATELGFTTYKTIGVTTNGTLLTDSLIQRLHDNNIKSVCISIDGLEKTHESLRKLPGCYPKLKKSVKKIQEYKDMSVGITTVVNKKNICELEELYKQFLDWGIGYWRVFGVDPIGRAAENKDLELDKEDYETMFNFILEKRKEKKMIITYGCGHYLGPEWERKIREGGSFYCGTGVDTATILGNGDIFGCSNIPREKKLIQGNVRKDNFVDVWENKFQIYRDINTKKSKKCEKCNHWKYCLGDTAHSYDYKNNTQLICMKDILKF